LAALRALAVRAPVFFIKKAKPIEKTQRKIQVWEKSAKVLQFFLTSYSSVVQQQAAL
jgi:hypothetical protein